MTGTAKPSPRTPHKPMAFTAGEFTRGALYAWLWFLLISTLAFVPFLGLASWIALIFTGPWSVGALLLGSPLAFGLGRVLQHNPSMPLHAVIFTGFGALLGISTTALAAFAPWSNLHESSDAGFILFYATVSLSASIAVPLGWRQTAHRALRRDQTNPAPQPARA